MKSRLGFTLLELIMVVALILILLAILIPTIGMLQRIATKNKAKGLLARVDTACEQYRQDYGYSPLYYTTSWTSGSWTAAQTMNSRLYTLLVSTDPDPKGRNYPGYLSGPGALGRTEVDTAQRLILDPWGNPVLYLSRCTLADGATNYGWPTGLSALDSTRLVHEVWSAGPDAVFAVVRGTAASATVSSVAAGMAQDDNDNVSAKTYNPDALNQQ